MKACVAISGSTSYCLKLDTVLSISLSLYGYKDGGTFF